MKSKLVDVRGHGDYITVAYRGTTIVTFNRDKIILNTGGWRTLTTKRFMNEAAETFKLGYLVYQVRGKWFVAQKNNQKRLSFDEDTITLTRL